MTPAATPPQSPRSGAMTPPDERRARMTWSLVAEPQDALALATSEASGLDVRLGGGPTVVRDFLRADLVDHLHLVVVPIVLGRGVRLWDGLEGVEERFDITATPSPSGVVHYVWARKPRE